MSTVEAYPLEWPDNQPRTKRPVSSRYGHHTLREVRDYLTDEVRRLGGRSLVISTNMKTRKDGGVYSNAREPEDSGVAVYFQRNEKPVCLACDHYARVWENTYAIARTIAALRQISRDGVSDFLDRAFQGFVAIPETTGTSWYDVLGVSPDATEDEIRQAFRSRMKTAHPDTETGSHEQVLELQRAMEQWSAIRGSVA